MCAHALSTPELREKLLKGGRPPEGIEFIYLARGRLDVPPEYYGGYGLTVDRGGEDRETLVIPAHVVEKAHTETFTVKGVGKPDSHVELPDKLKPVELSHSLDRPHTRQKIRAVCDILLEDPNTRAKVVGDGAVRFTHATYMQFGFKSNPKGGEYVVSIHTSPTSKPGMHPEETIRIPASKIDSRLQGQ